MASLYAQQKEEIPDSVCCAYKVHVYTDSTESVRTYTYAARKDSFQLSETAVTLKKNDRVQQYCVMDGKGDSSVKVVYFYSDTNEDVEYYNYKYIRKKAKLKNTGYFYRARLVENEFVHLLAMFLEYDVYLCDSMLLMDYSGLVNIAMSGKFFGNLADAQPDSMFMQTSIAGITVNIRSYMKAKDNLLSDIRMTLSALDGQIHSDLLKAHADYNAIGQLVRLEVFPFKTSIYNLYKEMNGFFLRTYSYEENRLRCLSEYTSSSEDTAAVAYRLSQRTYYTYRDGKPDTVYVYNQYAGVHKDTASLDMPALLKVEIRPNPVLDQLTVNGLESPTRMELYTSDGRRIWTASLTCGDNSIALPMLSAGIYFVKLRQGTRECVKKIVKR